jgi:hydroxymethylglutaryl-CoA reductase (NADPH)
MADRLSNELVPRYSSQEYRDESLSRRRRWVEQMTGADLSVVGAGSISAESMRGNIENPIGTVQMPLGIAGPLAVRGEHADGVFYVPLATTEGALVRSYERGMVLLTRVGGAQVWIERDENQICPVFQFDGVAQAAVFGGFLAKSLHEVRAVAEATTSHGRLLAIEPWVVGRDVEVAFRYHTSDAHGMNMIVKATDAACRWLLEHSEARSYLLFSGLSSEKRPSARGLLGGKGKKVTAGAEIPAKWVRLYLHTTPDRIRDLWQRTIIGNVIAGAIGYCGHYANGLTALFIACGQDVANIANSAVGLTNFEVTPGGDLYASITLSSLVLATVGGGVDLGTSRECLEMLGCRGSGKVRKLTEIVAATILAGELSFAGALASGEVVSAHEDYGRNRPRPGF